MPDSSEIRSSYGREGDLISVIGELVAVLIGFEYPTEGIFRYWAIVA